MEHICKEQLATSLINLGVNTAVPVNKHLKERKSQNKQNKNKTELRTNVNIEIPVH